MCGIHLIIQKSGSEFDCGPAIERMVAFSSHRGPDGYSTHTEDWSSEKIWLGHNLLAISDTVANARQPMFSADGSFGIVFNGQIYNHAELREMLENEGISFGSNGDTEVLMYWLRQHGRKGLRKLVGMYAFVYWDCERELCIVHRDGYGIKPLYFSRNRHFFVASSEPGAIAASGIFRLVPDGDSIAYYLKYKFVPAPATPWIGVKSLLPGEAIEYWEGKPMHYQVVTDYSKTAENVEMAMDTAFSSIIPTNEKFGLMLSGGVDSTLILLWCLRHKLDVVPFSIRFGGEAADKNSDEYAVNQLEKALPIKVEWVDISANDLIEMASFHHGHLKTLVADSAWFLTERIAVKASRLGIRILLSGAGADEWFGGYRRHWYYHKWAKFNWLIPDRWQMPLVKKLRTNTGNLNKGKDSVAGLVWDAAVSGGLTQYLKTSPYIPLRHKNENTTHLESALYWDQWQYLPNDILSITDAATMAYGIEGRFPFLHPAITQFADSFAADFRLANGRKWMLTQLFSKNADIEFVTKRKKQGFGVPFSNLSAGESFRQTFIGNLESKYHLFSGWFDEQSWQEMMHRFTLAKNPQEMLSLCWLAQWLENQSA